MTDHDQRPTRSQPSACFREDVVLDVKVGQQHEVEGGAVRWLPRPYVGDDPVDVDTGSASPRTTPLDTHGREVDCGDLPSQGGEPDGVATLPRAQVQRPT